MSHKNPYREGSQYAQMFGFWQSDCKGIVTRQALMEFATGSLKLSEDAAAASVTVILSPRKESKRGNCRGNLSAQGHLYFAAPLAKVVRKGADGEKIREPRKFRLMWRPTELEARVRTEAKPKVKKPAKRVRAVKTHAGTPVEGTKADAPAADAVTA